jgi:hypothetical protein
MTEGTGATEECKRVVEKDEKSGVECHHLSGYSPLQANSLILFSSTIPKML